MLILKRFEIEIGKQNALVGKKSNSFPSTVKLVVDVL